MKLIILYDIVEWLVGQVDDANDNEDPTLNWAIVYKVSCVGEPIIYTRRKQAIKESNYQVVVLLLDLPTLP
ncbi:hypothetical protein VIGAN_06018300 [Vigna angularis var. angularis]|uniref:Uncharacterized protein n=1 Tax=Vigna angularis var. angularis TaxID=157739 RepID=A0A0S3S8W0_PHAAN|nr:hypothetical protein VIGAN_06018300 [Vigna angularis var. angularis]